MNAQDTSDFQEGRSSTSPSSASAPGHAPGPEHANDPAHEQAPSQLNPGDCAEAPALSSEPTGTPASKKNKQRNVREYTPGEEIANSVTHGLGAVFSVVALPLLVSRTVADGGDMHLFAVLVYAISMLAEYVMSTLYHALTHDRAKRVFKVLDHSFIYLFIAGSYTPFCLISLADVGGIWLCVFVWAVAFAGVACEAFWVFRPRWISALLYLLMGWCIVWFVPQLLSVLPAPGLYLLIGGGLCYSVGCIFYVLKKIPYMHSIFHLWVLAGSVCQFFAIYLYVL